MKSNFMSQIALTPDAGLKRIPCSKNGLFQTGCDGVEDIIESKDGQYTFLCYKDKTIVQLRSGGIYDAYYSLPDPVFEGPARYVLMDLDGTAIDSEHFWIGIIQKSISQLMGNPKFCFEDADLPHVSGYSVAEHLRYCIEKYCPDKKLQDAREIYKELEYRELTMLLHGTGHIDAFRPMDGLKDFIRELKKREIKIALVSSGSRFKVQAEVAAACRQIGVESETEIFDCVMTGGIAVQKGEFGTVNEMAAKPHPWMYAEAARSGLGITDREYPKVIGLDDSAAGIMSLRLAGFEAIGMAGGNIITSGIAPLARKSGCCLLEALPVILGE